MMVGTVLFSQFMLVRVESNRLFAFSKRLVVFRPAQKLNCRVTCRTHYVPEFAS